MTKVLIVKMSALGDIMHTLPAVTDALQARPDLQIDWLCEEPFADIARLHPGIREVIPHGRLRWRKKRLALATLKEQWTFYKALRARNYDLVIDAQGRIKSARVGKLAGAPVYGPDKDCATDSETRFYYREGFDLTRGNAIEMTRELFSKALGYSLGGAADFGVNPAALEPCPQKWRGHLVFFHGTTWESKHFPESRWVELLSIAMQQQRQVLLPWGNEIERQRAERMVQAAGWGEVLPRMSLWKLSGVIAAASGAIGVDTGLMHVAAGIGIPTVSVFGSTSVVLTGAKGHAVANIQSDYECSPCRKKVCPVKQDGLPPCYTAIKNEDIWNILESISNPAAMALSE